MPHTSDCANREQSVIDEGQLIAGHYRLLEQVGSGSMGVVWRARDERLERTVAIKQLLAQPGLTEEQRRDARRRAMREARIAARLHHPNAIVVFDVAEHDGDPCLVMEYMSGRSLAAVLTDRGSLPVAEVAALGSQVASALAAAHASGIVHRDIKPGNVLIDDAGVAKITDFGIAKAIGDVTVTQTGLFAGTPAYLAPEVARGQDPTTASDVFSFGATLYDAIEGGPPFPERQNQLALLRLVAEGVVQPPKQAGVLTSLLMKLLRPDAADRPTMAQASTLLAELAGSPAVLLAGAASQPNPTKPDMVAPAPAPVPEPQAAAEPAPKLAPTAVAEPARPAEARPTMMATAARPTPKDAARQRTALFGAAALVVVIVVLGVLALTMNWFGGSQNAGNATGQHNGSTGPSTGQQAPPAGNSSNDPSTGTSPSSPPATGQTPYTGPKVPYGDAGVFVINFYNSGGPAAHWNQLSTYGQSFYGNSEQQFQSYWGGFTDVGGSGAKGSGLYDNADGSANVPVTLSKTVGQGQPQIEQLNLKVIYQNGQLVIDGNTK